jgi:hypothetical protein
LQGSWKEGRLQKIENKDEIISSVFDFPEAIAKRVIGELGPDQKRIKRNVWMMKTQPTHALRIALLCSRLGESWIDDLWPFV